MTILLSLACAWSPLAVPDPPRAGDELAVRMAEGAGASFRATNDTKLVTTLGDFELALTVHYDQDVELKALAPDADDNLVFEFGFGRIVGEIHVGTFETVAFDSASPREDYPWYAAPAVLPMLDSAGKTATAVVSSRGEVLATEGWEGLFGEAAPAPSTQGTSSESLVRDAQWYFARLPESDAAAEASWKTVYSVPVFESRVDFELDCEPLRRSDDRVEWSSSGVVEAADDAAVEEDPPDAEVGVLEALSSPMQATVRRGSFLGSFTVSRSDGLPVRQALDLSAQLELLGPLGPQPFEMEWTQRFSIERIEREDGE